MRLFDTPGADAAYDQLLIPPWVAQVDIDELRHVGPCDECLEEPAIYSVKEQLKGGGWSPYEDLCKACIYRKYEIEVI